MCQVLNMHMYKFLIAFKSNMLPCQPALGLCNGYIRLPSWQAGRLAGCRLLAAGRLAEVSRM